MRRPPYAAAESIGLEPTRVYRAEDAREFLAGTESDVKIIAPTVEGPFMSAVVHARPSSA